MKSYYKRTLFSGVVVYVALAAAGLTVYVGQHLIYHKWFKPLEEQRYSR